VHRIQDTGYRIHQGQILNIGYRIQEPGNTRDIDTEYRYRIQDTGYTRDIDTEYRIQGTGTRKYQGHRY